jgi:hypothetical protein
MVMSGCGEDGWEGDEIRVEGMVASKSLALVRCCDGFIIGQSSRGRGDAREIESDGDGVVVVV